MPSVGKQADRTSISGRSFFAARAQSQSSICRAAATDCVTVSLDEPQHRIEVGRLALEEVPRRQRVLALWLEQHRREPREWLARRDHDRAHAEFGRRWWLPLAVEHELLMALIGALRFLLRGHGEAFGGDLLCRVELLELDAVALQPIDDVRRRLGDRPGHRQPDLLLGAERSAHGHRLGHAVALAHEAVRALAGGLDAIDLADEHGQLLRVAERGIEAEGHW